MNELTPISTLYEEIYADAWKALCRKEGHIKSLPFMADKDERTGKAKRKQHMQQIAGDWFAGVESGTVKDLAEAIDVGLESARCYVGDLAKRGKLAPMIKKRGGNQCQIYRATDKLVAEVAARS